jgi:DNA-binding MarR family transcriptional regulator
MGFRMSNSDDGRLSEEERRELAGAHLGRLLLQALRQVEAASMRKLRERGHRELRTGHIPVFGNVAAGGMRITDLAARAGMTRQMMGRLVRELEDLGYAASRPDPADQRAIIVELTDRGWQFCHDAQEVMVELEREYDAALGPGDLGRLRAALTILGGG